MLFYAMDKKQGKNVKKNGGEAVRLDIREEGGIEAPAPSRHKIRDFSNLTLRAFFVRKKNK